MDQSKVSVKDAFLKYAKGKTSIPSSALVEGLVKVSDFCRLDRPLIEITDVHVVRKVQQQVAEGKLLHFRFGREAQKLREITQLYYSFVKYYHSLKKQEGLVEIKATSEKQDDSVIERESSITISSSDQNSNGEIAKELRAADFRGFGEWMKGQGMTERSSYAYIGNLLAVHRFKIEHHIGQVDIIGTNNPDKIQIAIDELLGAPVFVQHNKDHHYTFLAALKKYKQFLAYLHGDERECAEEKDGCIEDLTNQLNILVNVIMQKYKNGFSFNDNALRLLSEESGIEITKVLQGKLKKLMIKRDDNTWFLIQQIASSEVLDSIIHEAIANLEEYHFFEAEELLSVKRDHISESIIRNVDDFEVLLFAIIPRDIRSIRTATKHIIKLFRYTKEELFADLAKRIVILVHDEYGGVMGEDDISLAFPFVSTELIQYIIKEYADDLVRIEINDTVCYQTLDALGLPEDFSQSLEHVLSEFTELGIEPTSENIHTALAIYTRMNIRRDFGITDDKTFRRLVAIYDTSNTRRKWKAGKYREGDD